MKKVTLESIAKKVGVSKVAVYKALNNKGGVSDAVKSQILEVASTLGYKKAKKDILTDMHFLYLVNKSFFLTTSEQFYTSIYYYLNEECDKSDSNLKIVFFDDAEDNLTALKKTIQGSKYPIDGIFIAGEVPSSFIEKLSIINIPIIFIDYYSPIHNYSYIYPDNYRMSYMITKYLIQKGHQKIGFVGDDNKTSAIADRFYGYRKALSEENIEFKPEWHINQNIEHMMEVTDILPKRLPTAFVCHCDPAAHKMYTLLSTRGLSVPDDVSIISFDNTQLCENITPKLSSIGCSKEYYAKKSYSAMMSIISDNNKVNNVILKPVFVERDSVKSLK